MANKRSKAMQIAKVKDRTARTTTLRKVDPIVDECIDAIGSDDVVDEKVTSEAVEVSDLEAEAKAALAKAEAAKKAAEEADKAADEAARKLAEAKKAAEKAAKKAAKKAKKEAEKSLVGPRRAFRYFNPQLKGWSGLVASPSMAKQAADAVGGDWEVVWAFYNPDGEPVRRATAEELADFIG